ALFGAVTATDEGYANVAGAQPASDPGHEWSLARAAERQIADADHRDRGVLDADLAIITVIAPADREGVRNLGQSQRRAKEPGLSVAPLAVDDRTKLGCAQQRRSIPGRIPCLFGQFAADRVGHFARADCCRVVAIRLQVVRDVLAFGDDVG